MIINSYDPETKVFTKVDECIADPLGKALIITLGPFSQEDMRLLWMASEPETVVTGDQSLSEAVASHKKFVYECRTHKRGVASHLQRIFSEFSGREDISVVVEPTYDPAALLQVYSFKRADDPDTMQKMDELIIRTKDCTLALRDCVHRLAKK